MEKSPINEDGLIREGRRGEKETGQKKGQGADGLNKKSQKV